MEYWKMLRDTVGNMPIMLMAAGVIIQNKAGEILLQKRSDSNKWGIPGGMLDYGESAEEAAIREVHEETGVDVAIIDMLGVYSKYFHKYENGDTIQMCSIFFRGKMVGGEVKIDQEETVEVKFFDERNLPEIFHPQREQAIQDFFEKTIGVWR